MMKRLLKSLIVLITALILVISISVPTTTRAATHRIIYSSKGWTNGNFARYMDYSVMSNNSINRQADKLKRKSTSATAQAVSSWINSHLKYGHPKGGGGAIRAFQQRRGVCTDQSYLTVAMLSHLKVKVRLVSSRPLSHGLMNHVWTEVWIPSKHQWRVYDSTCGLYDYSEKDYMVYLDWLIEPNTDHKHQHIIGQWN